MIGKKENYMENVVIIGGGASAIMCAIANAGKSKITIVEKSDKIGKKILVTGNGRCNLTNLNLSAERYNTPIVGEFFNVFSSNDTIKFFNELGLEVYSDEEGRVYPISNSANSVLDVLRLKLNTLNVEVKCDFELSKISKTTNGFYLHSLSGEKIFAQKLIVATGGNTSSQILQDLDVKYDIYRRSLGALKSEKNKGLNGVKVRNAKVTLNIGGKQKNDIGELLFKDDALSGIVIFNVSTLMARENANKGVVSIDFLPQIEKETLYERLKKQRKNFAKHKTEDFLTGIFHKALNINLLNKCNIELNKFVNQITDIELNMLCNLIKDYKVRVYEVSDNNQVYSGGVNLSDLNEDLSYKNQDNLYFIGESINVDGECGGFNLQWAWTSGYIVGVNL